MEKKETTKAPDYYLELDSLYVSQKIKIDSALRQSYRNNANFLKKAKQKVITIKKVGDDYFAIRVV